MTDDEKGEYKIQVGKRSMTNEVEDKNWQNANYVHEDDRKQWTYVLC